MSFTCEKPCECPVCFEPLNEDTGFIKTVS